MEYVLKNGVKLLIRCGEPADEPAMGQYIKRVAGESVNLTFTPDEYDPETSKGVIGLFADPANGLYLIAEAEGEIIGNLTFRLGIRSRTRHAGEFGLSVRRDFWGLGVGTRLVEELIDWAKILGHVRKINLRVREDNERAIAMYRRLGFAEEGRITRDFLCGGRFVDLIAMGLPVDPE